MKIATASLNQTPLDWNRNVDNIRCAIEWVRERNTMVLCLPELCIPGVGAGPHFRRQSVRDKSLDLLFELLPELKGMIVTLGLPVEFEGHLFNTSALVVDGQLFGFQCKTNFSASSLHELAWFRPWPRNGHTMFELNGHEYRIGDLSFEFNLSVGDAGEPKKFHVAVDVGEPAWNMPQAPSASQRQKLDLLLNPSASRFALEKHAGRRSYAETATKEHDYVHVFSNYVGNESGPSIYDGGSFVAERGKIVAETPRFSYHDVQIAVAELDREIAMESENLSREEEFSHAVPLGMMDYLRKSGTKGFALSLSGGADSGALAVMVLLGIRFAHAELGPEGFARQFAFIPGIDASTSLKDIVHKMLTCFYQSTKNSSETTRRAARIVADSIGAEFHDIDIDKIVDDYTALVSKAIGRELTWEDDDLAMQNVQARARVPSAWLFANIDSKLLLAAGNRSEAIMGYTTMDGDTCGCLAPIGGIDKAFLRHWIRWMETEGPVIGGKKCSMPFLSVISEQEPTAELRPIGRGQTDESDLMPYTILNRIEQLGVAQGKKQQEILDTLRQEFPEYDEESLLLWIGRFFRRWARNQWKRNRYAMSFHLDDSTLSGDEWQRFPPLSGS